ncbi:hypothetical protein BKA70DRAFT_1294713 [Coprinopsis sp. MPI-PUGE-AT-0042]|nr:hypothetical protein BKA70DRAFT_1294713 [Coprinopsis sp. MPI-PUGE-AT-0042]
MVKKGKATSEPAPFPWDLIGANCLRTVCQQLGWKRTVTKARMIEFLQLVQANGLDDALQHGSEEQAASPEVEEGSEDDAPKPQTPARTKKRRKSPAAFSREPHNTRNKGTKRVRVTHDSLPSSSSSRRSVSIRRKPSAAVGSGAKSASNNDPPPPKRKRGRPRKNPLFEEAAPPMIAPSKGLFDGVVIISRHIVNGAVNGDSIIVNGLRRHDGVDDQDADGEEVDENDDLVDFPQPASSLASSNKENDPFIPPDPTIEPRRLHATIADAINAANAS